MPKKLKNLKVTKVDFVDEGANPRADIALTKSKGGASAKAEGEQPEQGGTNNLFKRFMLWMTREGIPVDEIEKAATTFDEQLAIASAEQIRNELWSTCYALQNSINSILCDAEMTSVDRQSAMEVSVEQFAAAMKDDLIPSWTKGKTAGIQKSLETPDDEDLQMCMTARDNLEEMIAKAKEKGEPEEMAKIDKSKMTAEERAQYDELIKKYAVEETIEEIPEDVTKAADPAAKGEEDPEDEEDEAKKKGSTAKSKSGSSESESEVVKGMIADLRSEIAKMREEKETLELASVAKKYEALGKKPEEMIETLKKAKKAGLYEETISTYDAMLEAQASSGVFTEFGKSAEGTADSNGLVAKAKAAAVELRKSNPTMTEAQALDAVLVADPELLKAFDQ